MTPYKLKMRAAMRRYGQSQSDSQIQNSLSQVGTSSERAKPGAEVGKFKQFNSEAGAYIFDTPTSSVSVPPSQMLSNGRLGRGQKVLIAQGFADFIPV